MYKDIILLHQQLKKVGLKLYKHSVYVIEVKLLQSQNGTLQL